MSFIFAGMYIFDETKAERILAAFFFSFFGAIFSLLYIYTDTNQVQFPTIFAIISLAPAICLA